MNLTRSQKVRLGAFLISGLGLFLAAVLTLTGLKLWEQRDRYTVRFSENISGLEPSASVRYNGLRVGRVDDMLIPADDPNSVEVLLGIDPRTVLYEGTYAVLETSGLTGLKSINITPGDPRGPRVVPGSRLPSRESLVDRLTGRAEEISVKIELVTNQLARWTSDENRERAERLLESLAVTSEEVARFLTKNRDSFDVALRGVGDVGRAFSGIANEGTRSIEAVRLDVGRTLEEARTTLKSVRRPLEDVDPKDVAATLVAARKAMTNLEGRLSGEQLGETLASLQTALAEMVRVLQEADLAVRAGREDFVSSLRYLRQASEDVREFSRIIAQDPSALLRGRD